MSWVSEEDDAVIVGGKKNNWERRTSKKTDVERVVPIMHMDWTANTLSSVLSCMAAISHCPCLKSGPESFLRRSFLATCTYHLNYYVRPSFKNISPSDCSLKCIPDVLRSACTLQARSALCTVPSLHITGSNPGQIGRCYVVQLTYNQMKVFCSEVTIQ